MHYHDIHSGKAGVYYIHYIHSSASAMEVSKSTSSTIPISIPTIHSFKLTYHIQQIPKGPVGAGIAASIADGAMASDMLWNVVLVLVYALCGIARTIYKGK